MSWPKPPGNIVKPKIAESTLKAPESLTTPPESLENHKHTNRGPQRGKPGNFVLAQDRLQGMAFGR